MEKPVKTESVGELVIKIYTDDCPESPRDWDNLGTMVCFHRNYIIGDEKHGFDRESLLEKISEPNCVSLPIFLFDHSGQTISTCSDNFRMMDPVGWDWGKIGFIFADEDRIMNEYNLSSSDEITQDILDKVKNCLVSEVEVYRQYMEGDIYGFVIEDEEETHLDSCWGFYGLDDCLSEAKSIAEHINSELVGSGTGI